MQASKAIQQSIPAVKPDFTLQNEGTIYLLTPLTDSAKEWVSDHLPEDAQWFGNGVVVEHRYIACIVQGIQDDGLAVQA